MRLLKKLAVTLPLVVAILFLQSELDARKIHPGEVDTCGRLTDVRVLQFLSLGFEEVIADYYWFKTVLYAGSNENSMNVEYFTALVDQVITLDPQFQYPYIFGSVILSIEANDYKGSDRLLLKGFTRHPDTWRFPFGLGYNSYFHHGDPEEAARYLAIAARLPHHPSYLPALASRAYFEAGNSEVAIKFLEAIIEETPEGQYRKRFEQRLEVLRTIRFLEKLVVQFRQDGNGHLDSLHELVSAGYLRKIPHDPYGGEFYLNENGRVFSTSELRPVNTEMRKGGHNG